MTRALILALVCGGLVGQGSGLARPAHAMAGVASDTARYAVRDEPLPNGDSSRSAHPLNLSSVPVPPSVRVLASWYGSSERGDPSGDQMLGNVTACGVVLTRSTQGVASRTLPCGSLVRLEHAGRSVTVPVIDRGPFYDPAHRVFDLAYATHLALGCPDLCWIGWSAP